MCDKIYKRINITELYKTNVKLVSIHCPFLLQAYKVYIKAKHVLCVLSWGVHVNIVQCPDITEELDSS